MKAANGQLPRPRADVRLYLFHGADEAGADDLARQLAAGFGDAERVDLDGMTLKREPGRLADEAAALSLFGDARLIRAAPIGEENVEAVSLLLAADRAGSPVIAVAPSVKVSGKLVKLAIDHPQALAIACYAPTAADAERLAQALLTGAGLRPAPGLARRLADAAGADRAVMAREVDKLALYLDAAPERPRDASTTDLDAVGAGEGDDALDAVADLLVEGKPGAVGAALARLDENGASPITWLRALQRRLLALGDMRDAVDRGEPVATVMKRHRVHFSAEARTQRDLRRWQPPMIAAALSRVRAAELATMASHGTGPVAAEQAAVALARRVAAR